MPLSPKGLTHGKDIFYWGQATIARIADMLDIHPTNLIANSHLLDCIFISAFLAGSNGTHNQSTLLVGQADQADHHF